MNLEIVEVAVLASSCPVHCSSSLPLRIKHFSVAKMHYESILSYAKTMIHHRDREAAANLIDVHTLMHVDEDNYDFGWNCATQSTTYTNTEARRRQRLEGSMGR